MSQEHHNADSVPTFTSAVPPALMATLDPTMRWLYEQASIREQQMQWMMLRVMNIEHSIHSQLTSFQAHVVQDKLDFEKLNSGIAGINEQVSGWRKAVDFVCSKSGALTLACTAIGAIVLFAASQGWIKADLGDTRIQYRPAYQTNILTTPQQAQPK